MKTYTDVKASTDRPLECGQLSRTRPYQDKLKADLYEALKSFNVVGGALPTGGGKTILKRGTE